MTATTYEPITLLNASGEILSTNITLQKAARLLVREKAVIHESIPGRFLRDWAWPKVLRLVKYVYIPYNKLHGPPRVSKRGVLLRDRGRCAYLTPGGIPCPNKGTTIDHIHPRSKGGHNTWINLVGCCITHNHKKGNRTVEEANMTLQWKGFVPQKADLYVR